MSHAGLERALPAGDRLLLDTTTLIAYLGGGEAVSSVASPVVDGCVRSGRNHGLVSRVTAMELLVRPMRQSPTGYRHVHEFLTTFPNLRLVEIDLPVAQEAAGLRAAQGFRPPDALVVGSGLVHQVGHLVTNDDQWSTRLAPIRERVRVCLLSSHLPFP